MKFVDGFRSVSKRVTVGMAFAVKNIFPMVARMAATAGDGGDVYLLADENLNTLIDFRFERFSRCPAW